VVNVKPFRGIRYDKDKVSLQDVITPPYDVINPEERDMFYHRSPHNAVRIILNKGEGENRYVQAKEELEKWIASGVLKRDEAPALYIYEQEFMSDGAAIKRMGFIGSGQLHEYEEGVVIPHEKTLSKAKDDRFNLTMTTGASFGVVFMLYHDPSTAIDSVLRRHADTNLPEYDAVDHFGVRNRVWVLKEPSAIQQITSIMANKKIYIADGHHRYETALKYKNKMTGEKGSGDWDYGLMMFINMKAPGLIIYPTHRWVKSLPYADIDIMLDDCMELFDVHPLDMSHSEAYAELERMGKHSFLVFDDRYHILTLKDPAILDQHGDLSKSEAWRSMDVSILHSLLFEKYLEIDQDNLQEHVKYTRDRKEAVEKVSQREYEAAFLMLPPTMEEFIAVADAGEKMPQKSTYFYPKLVTGLVFYKMDGNSL